MMKHIKTESEENTDPEFSENLSPEEQNQTLSTSKGEKEVWRKCFEKLLPEEIYDHNAIETNRYGKEMLERKVELSQRSRFNKWEGAFAKEMKVFVIVEIGMGLVHKGKESSIKREGRLGSRVVQTLTSGYETKGHHVFVDNFFSSIDLFEALRENKLKHVELLHPITRVYLQV
ncbi:hypothetical protein J437_LFUL004298 [Ladona fulva]|uniref:PiggyBac transposable element-derived protein domain-containing protein n=1 Tax=Ladona fulva TaxID=123851 RepID=A0A8K0JXA5_LADFU|nr:hypothetical protein J437_LFUL004298 [Ladona fulva]